MLDVTRARGVVIGPVGGSQTAHEGLVQVPEGTAAVGEKDASPTVGIDHRFELIGSVVQGLVPPNGLPVPLAAIAHANHGPLNAFVVVDQGLAGGASGTKGAVDAAHVGIALNELNHAVFCLNFNGAPYRAHAADAESGLFRCHRLLSF